jgi:secreted PhoX family phosphatase
MTISRRQFLTYLGISAPIAFGSQTLLGESPTFPLPRQRGKPPEFFTPISPSSQDALLLPPGFKSSIVIRWDDPLGSNAPDSQPEKFGFNNDFIAYFSIDALSGGNDSTEGLLWINHEYPNPLFIHGYTPDDEKNQRLKNRPAIELEKLSVGGTVLHVKQVQGVWKPVIGSKYNRRFTATYPEIELSGPASNLGLAKGTLAGCSGGVTPWHTALSCEENYPDFNSKEPNCWRWSDVPGCTIDEKMYGWIVEIDPFKELPPIKHTALGRFKHENAAVKVGPTGRLVIYMGDDEADQHLYKFVSAEKVTPGQPREEQRKILESGTLFAADLLNGKWIPLEYTPANAREIHQSPLYLAARKKDPLLKIESQGEMLIHTRIAARILGATPLDRCEDCEVHPDGSLYVALTNSVAHGNLHGHIMRLVEEGNNHEGTAFKYEVFLAGGPQSGLSCPDNLAFDQTGNLWVMCDISSTKLGKGAYKPFANNGVFVVPTSGESAGDAFQFASGPVECEITGPCFTPDGSTLFVSIQHPGEESQTLKNPTSHWPDGGNAMPRPSVVAITGFRK